MNPVQEKGSGLVRQIGLASGVAVVVGSTIGSGIFKSPAGIAEKLPNPMTMLMVWIIGGFIVLCGALTLAEVGSSLPLSGGVYAYIREAFGKRAAFLFGWAQLVLIRPAGVGALSLAFSQYALTVVGITDKHPSYILFSSGLAIAATVLVAIANITGVKQGTTIQNLTTITKTLGLLFLVVLAFAIGLPKTHGHFTAAESVPISWTAFGLALVSIFWAYDGWADGTYVGGEMVNAERNLPKAIIFGTVLVIVVYVLANIGYLAVLDVKAIANSPVIAADTMTNLVGNWGATFISVIVMISTFGTLNGTLLTSPRVFYALAEDELFPAAFGAVHPKFKTPYLSIALAAGLGVSYVLVASLMKGSEAFTALTDAFVIGILPFYALSVGAVYVLRRRQGYVPTVKTPGYPVTPVVFIAVSLLLLLSSMLDSVTRVPTLITLGLVVLGFPAYALKSRLARK
jgi:basic amino acid/polyamine antiporter, APA family